MNRAAVLTAVVAIGTIGLAQAQTTDPPPNALLVARLQAGATLERYLQNLRQEFLRLDADGDGKLDAADLESHTIMAHAMFRNSFAMQIMAADLDGDGLVTADEMRRKLHYDRRHVAAQKPPGALSPEEQIEAQVQKWLQADTDKDGKVTWHEALEAATREPNYARSIEQSFGSLVRQLQELAAQGTSAVTMADLEGAATTFFRRVDTDNNGTISTDELEAVRQTMSRYQALEQVRANCEMPKASQSAKVVLLGLYETESLSSVALGSQDEVTGVGNVTVEPGHDPLHVRARGRSRAFDSNLRGHWRSAATSPNALGASYTGPARWLPRRPSTHSARALRGIPTQPPASTDHLSFRASHRCSSRCCR